MRKVCNIVAIIIIAISLTGCQSPPKGNLRDKEVSGTVPRIDQVIDVLAVRKYATIDGPHQSTILWKQLSYDDPYIMTSPDNHFGLDADDGGWYLVRENDDGIHFSKVTEDK